MRTGKLLIIVLLAALATPAAADHRHERYVGPRHAPPAARFERHEARPGHVWISGHYDYVGNNYVWIGGRYERERPGYRWREHSWVMRDGAYVAVDGGWVAVGPTMAPPALRVERWEPRPGHIWVRGHWQWDGGGWAWVGGHYERERVGHRYREVRYEQRGGVYVTVDGGWD